jgi:two-component system LytT family sensor kinase
MTPRLKPWMLVSAAWIAPALLSIVSNLGQARLWGGETSLAQLLFDSLDWLIYGFFAPAIFAISERWPLTGQQRRRWAWLVHFLSSLLFCAAWAGAGTLLKMLLNTDDFERGVGFSLLSWFYITIPFGVGAYFGMVGIEHAIRHHGAVREWQSRTAQAEAQVTAARLAALESRLNPHFLFNALNTIAVLVRGGDTDSANRVVEELSDVLRLTLVRPGKSEVPLAEELDLVRHYLAVEQARFPDRLRLTMNVAADLMDAAVPSFALQHLVENAIRHGVASTIAAGRVLIAGTRHDDHLVLTVQDDGLGIASGRADLIGHGLENTRARLQALYGPTASLSVRAAPGGGTIAELRVPYRTLSFDPDVTRDA